VPGCTFVVVSPGFSVVGFASSPQDAKATDAKPANAATPK